MAKKTIAKNYLYNLVYQILSIMIPLITTPYLSRVLGAEKIGVYSFTLSITTYFVLFGSLGVAMYGQREIAFVQDDIDKRSKSFYEILIMKCITLLIAIILFYFLFCTGGSYHTYYQILLLEIVANIIDISWFFQGLEDFKKTVIRNTFVKIISVVCIFLLIKNQSDLYLYFFIYVFSNLFGNLSLWMYLPRLIKKQSIKSLNIKKHLKPTLLLFIPQIATQVYTVLDKTMIGIIILDKAEVGFYEQSQKIIKLLLTLATSLGIVMMPRIAATFAKGDYKKIKNYMNKSFSFILMLTFPLMLGIMSVSYHFVPVFYGEGYDKVRTLLCVISPIIVLIGLSNVIGTQYLLPTKQQKKYTISVFVGAIINFIFNLLLIKKYASIGASIATVIAELFVTITQFVLVRKEIRVLDVIKISYKYIIASIIMFLCSMFVGFLITNDLLSIIVQIFASGIVYLIMLILLKDNFIFVGIDLFKSKIIHRKKDL